MLDYSDFLDSIGSDSGFSVWTPSPAGDTAAPNDTLADNIWKGLKSIGSALSTGLQKTSDIFGDTLNNVAQAKSAWETIFEPDNAVPQNTQANSQLPSLQPAGDTSGQTNNWLKLFSALSSIYRGNGSNNVQTSSVIKTGIGTTLLIIGIFAAIIFFLIRRPSHA